MLIRSLFLVTIAACFYHLPGVRAQGSLGGSAVLEAYIRQGVAHNLSLKQEQLRVSATVESLKQSRALFFPQVTLAPTYSVALGGRRLEFPVGDMLNPAYTALNQLTGSNQFPTDIQNVNELLAPHNFHDTKVSFQYSLYNPEVRYNYLIQQSLLSAGEAAFKVAAAEVKFTISEAYFNYLKALSLQEVYRATGATMAEVVRLNTRLVSHNVATKDALLSSEYEASVLEKQQIDAARNVSVAASYFNYLLNRGLTDDIVADTLLTLAVLDTSVDLDGVLASALHNRDELKQLKYSVLAADYAVKLHEKAAALPAVFVGGNAGFQGFGYRFTNQAYMIAQVGLQWDLFKGFERKSKIAQARIQSDMLQTRRTEAERQIELEVTQVYYAVEAARQGVKVADAGRAKAEAFFRLADSRYRNQQLLMVEYTKAVNDLTTARIQQALAHYELRTQMAHLERVAGEL